MKNKGTERKIVLIGRKNCAVWRFPADWAHTWHTLHRYSKAICGNWFGIVLFPTGRVLVLSNAVLKNLQQLQKKAAV